jgi:hypothetical protein
LAAVVVLQTVRREWEDASRLFDEQRGDLRRYEGLLAELEVVLDELRRRIGQVYTLDELAAVYADAEPWAREAISEQAPWPGWVRDLTMVVGTAFHAYRTGATDYRP